MPICPPCKFAGTLLTAGKADQAVANHDLCIKIQSESGTTWCDCQHKTGHSVIATRSDG